MKKILIADDHEIVRLGISNVLRQEFTEANFFSAKNVNEILSIILKEQLDLAIIDIKMPGGSTMDLVKKIKKNFPKTKILIFTALNEDQYGRIFIKLGVDGFLSKLNPINEVLKAITVIENGGVFLSPDLAFKMKANKTKKKSILDNLSPRELEIADLIAQGYGNLEISYELDLKTSTVSTYKRRIIEKFRVENVVELVDIYRQQIKEQEEEAFVD